eukprot:gene21415-biopygen20663
MAIPPFVHAEYTTPEADDPPARYLNSCSAHVVIRSFANSRIPVVHAASLYILSQWHWWSRNPLVVRESTAPCGGGGLNSSVEVPTPACKTSLNSTEGWGLPGMPLYWNFPYFPFPPFGLRLRFPPWGEARRSALCMLPSPPRLAALRSRGDQREELRCSRPACVRFFEFYRAARVPVGVRSFLPPQREAGAGRARDGADGPRAGRVRGRGARAAPAPCPRQCPVPPARRAGRGPAAILCGMRQEWSGVERCGAERCGGEGQCVAVRGGAERSGMEWRLSRVKSSEAKSVQVSASQVGTCAGGTRIAHGVKCCQHRPRINMFVCIDAANREHGGTVVSQSSTHVEGQRVNSGVQLLGIVQRVVHNHMVVETALGYLSSAYASKPTVCDVHVERLDLSHASDPRDCQFPHRGG